MRTSSTRAREGPVRHHATIASTSSAGPSKTASTDPSEALRTHPARPRADARRAQVARKKTPWTRPEMPTRTRRTARSSHRAGALGATLAAMPGRYDDRTALVVVDVQNDFADPDGSLAVSGGEDAIPSVNEEIAAAEDTGAAVVYTQDWHPPTTPHFEKVGGIWPVHCVRGTWGAELHPLLRVVGEVVRKGTGGEDGYSGFSVRDPTDGATSPTILHRLLQERGVERLVVCGLATDYCVVETVSDAGRLGYAVEVPHDAIRAVEVRPGDGERAIERMRNEGAVVI